MRGHIAMSLHGLRLWLLRSHIVEELTFVQLCVQSATCTALATHIWHGPQEGCMVWQAVLASSGGGLLLEFSFIVYFRVCSTFRLLLMVLAFACHLLVLMMSFLICISHIHSVVSDRLNLVWCCSSLTIHVSVFTSC